MTHRNALRPAMTALAAVIALNSTPSFAQSVAEPVVTTTPPVDVTPAPVVADPIAAVVADPVATRTPSTTVRKKATVTKSTAARIRPTAARSTSPTVAPVAAIAAPVAAPEAVQPLPVDPIVAPPITAAPIAEAPATAKTIDILPTAGLAALGLLVLVGGALVLRSRRRRRLDELEEGEWQQDTEEQVAVDADQSPMVAPEPMLAEPEPVMAPPILATATTLEPEPESETKFIGPETELSDNFDLSRFGPNVQDAYRGPTEDNPSASLKQRLRRANGMDQQERKLDAEVEAATGESVLEETDDAAPAVDAPAATPTAAEPTKSDFIIARGNYKPTATSSVQPTKMN